MNSAEMWLSGIFSVFSSFFGTFAGGGSALLLLSFLLLTAQGSTLLFITLTKVATLALASVSGNLHRKASYLDWKMCLGMSIGGGLGVALSMFIAQYQLDLVLLKKIVAFTLLGLAFYQAFLSKTVTFPLRKKAFSGREIVQTVFVFFVLNIVHGITGAMGFFFVGYSVAFLQMSFTQAIAYSMISGLPVLALQTLYLISETHPPLPWMMAVALGSIVGAYFGTRFQYKKGDVWVKRASIVMMLVLGVVMLF